MPHSSHRFTWNAHCALRDCAGTPKARAHHAKVQELRAAIQSGHAVRLVQGQPIADPNTATKLFCQTGGSTGTPKIIERSQASWITSFHVNANLFDITQDACTAVFGDLRHSLALYGVIEAAHLGADICMLADLRATTQRAQIVTQGVTHMYLTPTQLKLLMTSDVTCPSVRHIIVGGGVVPDGLRSSARETFPNAVVTQFYGASETSFIAIANASTPNGSVGALYPNVALKFTGPNGAPQIGHGEIWVKSPYLFDHYAQGSSADTRCADGYVTIGEIGRLDASNNLYLLGRKSRMVSIADQNVFPEEIEAFIAQTFDPVSVAVVARTDALRGQTLTAIIQGQDGQEDTILRACRAKFGALASPRRVILIDTLPLLKSGKTDLITLANWLETRR